MSSPSAADGREVFAAIEQSINATPPETGNTKASRAALEAEIQRRISLLGPAARALGIEVIRAGSVRASVRVWTGQSLAGATCRTCLRLVEAENLVTQATSPGGKKSLCKSCGHKCSRQRYERNAPAILEKQRTGYRENREERLAKAAAYWAKNREERLVYHAKYRENNRMSRRKAQREYLRLNPGNQSEYRRSPRGRAGILAYRASGRAREHAEAYRRTPRGRANRVAAVSRRRARKKAVDCGCVTGPSLVQLAALSEGLCDYCGAAGEHFDHIIALAKGGVHCVSNLRLACARCNLNKHTKSVTEFVAYMEGAVTDPGVARIACLKPVSARA